MGFFLIFRLKIWLDFFLKSSCSAMFFKQFKTLFQMSELSLKTLFINNFDRNCRDYFNNSDEANKN